MADERDMRRLTCVLRFSGRLANVGPGLYEAQARAPAVELLSLLGGDPAGVLSREAVLLAEVVLCGEDAFEQTGTITFGDGDALHLASLARGSLRPTGDPALRHGTAMLEVAGGEGRLRGARGRVTSNFLVSAQGHVQDTHLAVIFVPAPASARGGTPRKEAP